MASFSVDRNKIVFASQRTGIVTLMFDNFPLNDYQTSISGERDYFTLTKVNTDSQVTVATKAVNNDYNSHRMVVRYTNASDSSDYIEIEVIQRGTRKPQHNGVDYPDIADSEGSLGSVLCLGKVIYIPADKMGGAEVLVDSTTECSFNIVSDQQNWLNCVNATPHITDTGFLAYNVTYIKNYDRSSRRGTVSFIDANSNTVDLLVYQEGNTPSQYTVSGHRRTIEDCFYPKTFIYIKYTPGSTVPDKYEIIYPEVYENIDDVFLVRQSVDEGNRYVSSEVRFKSRNYSSNTRTFIVEFKTTTNTDSYVTSVLIVQKGWPNWFEVSPDIMTANSQDINVYTAVLSDSPVTGAITAGSDWLSNLSITSQKVSNRYFYGINATAASNSTGVDRTGMIQVTNGTDTANIPVVQSSLSIGAMPSELFFDSNGGDKKLYLVSSSVLFFEAKYHSYPSWLTETLVDGDFYDFLNFIYTAEPNTSSSSRTGNIVMGNTSRDQVIIPVTQAGSASSISVSPSSLSFGPDASYADISLSYGGSYFNTAADEVYTWVTVNMSDKGGGQATGTVSVPVNNTTASRKGNIYFTDEEGGSIALPVEQSGIQAVLTANPSSLNIPAEGGTVTTAVTYVGSLSAASLPSWLSETHTDTDSSHRTYSLTAASNGPTQERTFNWRLDDDYNNMYVFISQAAKIQSSLVISPTSSSVGSSAGTVEITVRSTNISDIRYNISGDWIAYSSKGGSVYTFSYEQNPTTSVREGTITFSGGGISKTFTLTQEGKTNSITVNKNIFSVANGGGYLRDSITVTYTGKVTVESSFWITGVSSFSSTGTYKYSFSVSGNTETESSELRKGIIKFIGDNGTSCKVDVYQGGKTYGKRPVCMPDYTLGTYPAEGGQKYLAIDYYKELTYTGEPNWITLNIVAGGTGATDSIDDTSPVIFSVRALRNNSSSSRKGTMVFQGGDSLTLATSNIAVSQEGKGESDPLSVSPTELNYTAAGGTKSATVSGGTGTINVNNGSFPSWLSVKSAGGGVYNLTTTKNTGKARSFAVWFTDNTSTVTMNVYQQAGDTPGPGPGPGPTPVVTGSLKAYPMRLRYYSDGGSIAVSFTNRPRAGIGYTITYTDGTGWLSAEKSDPNVIVTATKNTGIRRRASIKFYDLGNSKNYVIVPVIQGSEDGYSSIWMDDLFYPAEGSWDGSGNYYYRIVDKDSNYEYFSGVAVNIFPGTVGEGLGGIDIPRLVEYYISTTLEEQKTDTGWADMSMGYCTVDVYNMTTSGYPGTVEATFKYWNDWSRFEKKYDYTRSLNDPINSKGCDNMIIPFCVYYDESSVFSIVDTERNGNVNTKTLSTPSKPFMMRTDSYYDSARIDYRQDGQILFSYDMTHCGQGALIYRNRFGGWDSFLIEGNISKTDNYTKQNYRKKGGYNLDYSIDTLKYIDEKRTEGVDIDTTYQAYTGWLTDEESERLVFHLLSSPTVFFQNLNKANQLYDTDSEFGALLPVRITASESEYKKFRNGKRLVNYLITFEKCNIEQVRR